MGILYILIFAWIGAVWLTYFILCFSWVSCSVYMWIVFVSVVCIDSSITQRNVCSTRSPSQISPWRQ